MIIILFFCFSYGSQKQSTICIIPGGITVIVAAEAAGSKLNSKHVPIRRFLRNPRRG
jgi:hypothetical protein